MQLNFDAELSKAARPQMETESETMQRCAESWEMVETEIEYDEENPENWLLAKDLQNWVRRGIDTVSIMLFTNETCADETAERFISDFVHDGSADYDLDFVLSLHEPEEYDENAPEDYLYVQDLIALSKHGCDEVEVQCFPIVA